MKKLRLSFLMLSLLLMAVGASAQKTSDCTKPISVQVEPAPTSALVSWIGFSDSYNVRYQDAGVKTVIFSEDFENGLEGWTIYTLGESPQSEGWFTFDPTQGLTVTAHSGSQVAASFSWSSQAFDADNWLVTPQVDLGGTLSFFDCVNGGYPDAYEVRLSTTGNKVEDFTEVLRPMANGTLGEWGEVSIDLSAYEGQKGYIAIHHTGYDNNYIVIDDFSIYKGSNDWIEVLSTTEESIEITGLKPSTTYEFQIQGVCADSESQWTTLSSFTTMEACPVPFDVTVKADATTATVSWKGYSEAYNVRYRIPASKEQLFFEGFEEGIPETWTILDNDGDGRTWYVSANSSDDRGFDSNHAASASYENSSYSALTPDNWLITPQLDLQGTLSVWLCGQDPSYAAEHFAVLLSTTGTAVEDFTEVLVPETVATGVLTQYTADLSKYKGQKGYIAIRHYNCTDMFILNVDNFALLGDEIGGSDWTTVTTDETTVELDGLEPSALYELQVQGVCDNVPTEWSDVINFTTLNLTVDLVLLDDDYDQPEGATNTDVLTENKGKVANVTFKDRVFYKDGEWNSLSLPFSLTAEQIANSPLADATIYELYGAGVDGKHVDFYFWPADEISSDWLYIFKWEGTGDNIVSPEFNNVKIDAEEGPFLPSPDYHAYFMGNYSTIIADPEADGYYTYYLGAGNKLRYSPNKVKIYPFRLYCVFFANEADPETLDYSFHFGDEHVDGIVELDGALKNNDTKGIYNLQGVKVNNAKQKGIYIMNGRKVVVK